MTKDIKVLLLWSLSQNEKDKTMYIYTRFLSSDGLSSLALRKILYENESVSLCRAISFDYWIR